MDEQRFDQLARVIGGSQSRRRAFKSVAGLGLAALAARIGIDSSSATTVPCDVICPGDVNQGSDPNQCGAVVNYPAPTSIGSCGPITCTPASGSFFPVGNTPITCNGGGDVCSFSVIVNDFQSPTITCPANITVIGESGTTITWPDPTVSDNCPGVQSPICNPPSLVDFSPSTVTIFCSVIDDAQNSSSCSFDVTLIEPTATATATETPTATNTSEPTLEPTTDPSSEATLDPTSDVPTSTEALPSAIAGTETPEGIGTVTTLPSTGSTSSRGGDLLLPAALVGGAAAAAARFGMRFARSLSDEGKPVE